MSEHALWGTVRDKLGRDGVWDRIENRVGRGFADTNYLVNGVEGWVELKHRPSWPKRKGPVTLDHFTQWQRDWLSNRWRHGGHAYLLLYIQRERTYLLFDGATASRIVGITDQADHEANAIVLASRRFPSEALRSILYRARG